ncbi:c-type cytochrome [Flavobacterium sp. N3904]|uniref:c-type cytochrome n=1 Tax=Flavobacterium sp. N3904 TaxID=2986835 RepID=UPI0022254D20|nr:c-type cytochrome [Flavobacterium sp. N3904]
MKKLLIIVTLLVFVSCKKESQEPFGKPEATADSANIKSPEVVGKEIFENKGNCIACHLPDKKLIGPSLHDIAKIYKEKNANIVTFLKGDGEPLVDPSQFEVMKTNFAITEEMSDEELQALEAYIFLH